MTVVREWLFFIKRRLRFKHMARLYSSWHYLLAYTPYTYQDVHKIYMYFQERVLPNENNNNKKFNK